MPARTLAALENIRDSFGAGTADRKLALLARLEMTRLRSAREVARLHEALCFLRAYPDDARVLRQVERMLARFGRRADLRGYRARLADTGIAGTTTNFRFFWSTARWLAQHCPAQLSFNRLDRDAAEKLAAALRLLVTPAERAWLDDSGLDAFAALDRLRGRTLTDAAWFVRSVESMPGDTFTREAFFDAIDAWFEFAPGPGTPTRTRARYTGAPTAFHREPLQRTRPDLRGQLMRPPRAVRVLPARAGGRLLDLARGAMATRMRDLDAFAYGNARDVRLVDDGRGLGFAVNGVLPERRALLPATYGYLILGNGVPMGYGEAYLFGRASVITFNIFETFRGGEAAYLFARTLAMVRRLFGAGSFRLDPYQLGQGNDEAIVSGAWWFYYKLGFRPQATQARRLLRSELARMQANPAHRSSAATLRKLADWPLFFDLDPAEPSQPPTPADLGQRVAASLAARTDGGREHALEACRQEAMRLTDLRTLRGFTAAEHLAWTRWSPLLVALPGLSGWGSADKRKLVRLVRAKGGRGEDKYLRLLGAHRRMMRALRDITA